MSLGHANGLCISTLLTSKAWIGVACAWLLASCDSSQKHAPLGLANPVVEPAEFSPQENVSGLGPTKELLVAPNACGDDGHIWLERAVAERELKRISLLLEAGADPHLRSSADCRTPLERVFLDDPPFFADILRLGIKPPVNGWDPWLWKALEMGHADAARRLLSQGARATGRGPGGFLPVELATLGRQGSIVKMLLDYGSPVGNALFLASARGDADMVSLLVSCGASPNYTRFPSRETPLSAAIRGKHDRAAAVLVRSGADILLRLPEGQAPLHLAVSTGCPRTVKELLDAGADPDSPFELPVSAEFLKSVRPGVMRWSLKNDSKITPLMVAADSGNIPTTRYLLNAGASKAVWTGKARLWPINFAASRNDIGMMRLFLGRDPQREERRIEIRLSEQRARLFDAEGNEVFSSKVSTGRKGFATPVGEFVITNKYRDWKSTLYDAKMPYFQRFSCGDFGLHAGNVPGYPASHGCVRVPAGDAVKLFSLTQTGDRVSILP